MPTQIFFLTEALNTIPRTLGLCDRSGDPGTFGCCDRTYWHYRLTDFPNARFQEIGLLLAFAYRHSTDNNPFCGNAAVLKWIGGIWNFWAENRNSDGSVSELYPRERCFCATAFSAAAFVQTVDLLEGTEISMPGLDAIEPTMRWLAGANNPEVFNQMAGSYLALLGYANLTGDPNHLFWAEERRDDMLKLQKGDGELPEYGGFDAGYQSISLSAMVSALELTENDTELRDVIHKGKSRVYEWLNPVQGHSSMVNSRNTQYIYPFSFAEDADADANHLRSRIFEGSFLRPTWMDDRYCTALATDFFRAGLKMGPEK
jgi:hypothetical protein